MKSSATTTATALNEVSFELQGLARAQNYQRWVFRTIEPYLGRRILEIGAGIGNMSRWMPLRERLILSETDPQLLAILEENLPDGLRGDPRLTVTRFDMLADDASAMAAENLDTIVSFNVLEHVEDDAKAIEKLVSILRDNGGPHPRRLITFVPAHSWAYGGMDKSFGHYRRYSRSALEKLARAAAPEARHSFQHFNLFGLAGWVLQGRILGKDQIGLGSIAAFEKLCPLLSPIDDLLHSTLRLPVGQSLLWVAEL